MREAREFNSTHYRKHSVAMNEEYRLLGSFLRKHLKFIMRRANVFAGDSTRNMKLVHFNIDDAIEFLTNYKSNKKTYNSGTYLLILEKVRDDLDTYGMKVPETSDTNPKPNTSYKLNPTNKDSRRRVQRLLIKKERQRKFVLKFNKEMEKK